MRILDATSGLREMWFIKDYFDCVYIDIRPEVKPDIVADMRQSPFQDRSFDLIVFDPPYEPISVTSIWKEKYGVFTTAEIFNFTAEAFLELRRILKDDGIILFKWNTHNISLKRILALVPARLVVLFGQHVALKIKYTTSTYWFCIVKS